MTTDSLSRGEAEARRAIVANDVAYEIALDLPEGGETFLSTTKIRFDCTAVSGSTFLNLDAVEVISAEINQHPATYDNAAKRVALTGLTKTDNVAVVVARCKYSNSGVGVHRAVDPIDGQTYLFTHAEPFDAHKWFACFDQPDIKGTYRLSVKAPKSWKVIANAPVQANEDEEDGTTTIFRPTPPISSYLAAFTAGPYEAAKSDHNGVAIGLYCRKSLAQYMDSDAWFSLTAAGLDFYGKYFDFPYPFEKYDHVMVPDFNVGAMENPGCVTYSERFLFRGKVTETELINRSVVLMHEMAHMWFGDLVTMRWWDDLWLNESFAEYMGYRATVDATPHKDAWVEFGSSRKNWGLRQDQWPTTHPVYSEVSNAELAGENFDGITYAKGAAIVRQLASWVGETAFREGISGYFKKYQWSNASFADFVAALEITSGRDVRSWADSWLHTPGVNLLRTDGTTLYQEKTPLRPHHAAIGIYSVAGESLQAEDRLEVDIDSASTALQVTEPQKLIFVTNERGLSFAKVRFDPNTLATLKSHLSDINDVDVRGSVWSTWFDMTRDAELPVNEWVNLVCRFMPSEGSVPLLQSTLSQAVNAVDLWAAPDHRQYLMSKIYDAAVQALQSAQPGSEVQLAWMRVLIGSAQETGQLETVERIYNGQQTFPGMTIDPDLGWLAVSTLVRHGFAGDELIDRQLSHDPTIIGKRRTWACKAARPNAAVKEQVWNQVVTDTSVGNATLRAVLNPQPLMVNGSDAIGGMLVGGLYRSDDPEMLAPFVSRFETAFETFWQEYDQETASSFTACGFPRYISEKTVEMADRLLAHPTLGAVGRRILLERKDDTLRALRCQQADTASMVPVP